MDDTEFTAAFHFMPIWEAFRAVGVVVEGANQLTVNDTVSF